MNNAVASVGRVEKRMTNWGLGALLRPWRRRRRRVAAKRALVALDRRIDTQLSAILANPRLQQLESSWRGLQRLAETMAGEARLGLRLLPVTREDLAEDVTSGSALRARIVTEPFTGERPEPFGLLVLDMSWSDGEEDVAILRGLARHAAAAFAPLLSGAGPVLLDARHDAMSPEWLALRDAPESDYLCLAGPRARHPKRPGWINAAVLLAEVVVLAVDRDGWGAWFDEPHGRPQAWEVAGPLEVGIGPDDPVKLFHRGLAVLTSTSDPDDLPAFAGVRSVRRTLIYERHEATANAQVSGMLAFVLGIGAVMRPLMIQARDLLRRGLSPEEVQLRLQLWMDGHHPAPQEEGATETSPALQDSRVELRPRPGGALILVAWLSPRMPLHELTTSMRQIAEIPALED